MKILLHNYENELYRLAETAKEIKVAIAFLTEGGIGWLPEECSKDTEFIVGTDLGITTPNALKALQARGVSVRIFREPGKLFHPKVIYMRNSEGEFLIVGSNNLTSSGISSNHEISLAVQRDDNSDGAFGDFLAYFDSLKTHECCGIPDDSFYATYEESTIRTGLMETLSSQGPLPLQPSIAPTDAIHDARIRTLGDFIRLVAEEFPKVDRRNKAIIKGHPLKVLNDDEFHPLFKEIVASVSHGRLEGKSRLNGGKWHRIPHIVAVDEDRESWGHIASRGVLALQVHFSDDYQFVIFSIVLQYELDRSIDAGQLPSQAKERYAKLHQHVENYSSRAELGFPIFRYFDYENTKNDIDVVVWSKPLLSFNYRTDSLPEDEILLDDLKFLANVVNGASAIT